MVWKCCDIWKNLMGTGFQMGQILWDFRFYLTVWDQCEILSHSVRYGIYEIILNMDFSAEKLEAREVTIFPEKI